MLNQSTDLKWKVYLLSLIFLLLLFPFQLLAETYWQQYVHYKINAKLDPDKKLITGSEILDYTNNSPDSLDKVYFRLYWNIHKEGSHGFRLLEKKKMYDFRGITSDENYPGVTLIKFALLVNGVEQPLDYNIDDTILEAKLPKILKSGETISFKIEWEEKVSGIGIRTGQKDRCFDIGQWYPQIAVYDKYGWHKDQYIGPGEFYNEYGTFEVNIEIPKSFIVTHSGRLLNSTEILPDSILKILDEAKNNPENIYRVANFSEREITDEGKSDYVIWKMKAENVRDFAFSAYEKYIWDAVFWKNDEHPDGGAMIHALYLKENEKDWKDEAAKYGYHAIKFFSENFGMYVYPNAFVMSSPAVGGGMEYPGIVFINSKTISAPYRMLFVIIVHELGHEWYPMMIGSNETEFEFMDEGFNTFITTLASEAYYENGNLIDTTLWYSSGLKMGERDRNQRQYFLLAHTGFEESVSTPTDHLNDPMIRSDVFYSKTSTVMFMLQYVLGDSIFAKLMKEYYNRWKFKHPYPEDFYNLAMEVSGNRDLRWFFDEWFQRTYTCDYGLRKMKSEKLNVNGEEVYRTTLEIIRNGKAILPLDILIEMDNGKTQSVNVPVNLWMNDELEQEITVDLPAIAKSAEINPDMRIADINRLNNTYPFPKYKVSFDNGVFNKIFVPNDAYWLRWRPSLWYNVVDGVKFGLKANASFLYDVSSTDAWILYGIKSKQIDFYFKTQRRIPFELSKNAFVGLSVSKIEGRYGGNLEFSKQAGQTLSIPPFHKFSFKVSFLKTMTTVNDYVDDLFKWEPGNITRIISTYNYSNRGRIWQTNFSISFESSSISSDFVYSKVTPELVQTFYLPKNFLFKVRLFWGYGEGNLPNQVKYYAASSSPVDQFEKPFFRSKIFPDKIREHLYDVGNANLRGYVSQNFAGDKAYALNSEFEFPSIFTLKPSLFFNVGKVWSQGKISLENAVLDCGISVKSDILKQLSFYTNIFSQIKVGTLRLDFPIYVSSPASRENKLKFRWVLGFEMML